MSKLVDLQSFGNTMAALEDKARRNAKREINRDNAAIRSAKILDELDKKLDRERNERQAEDEISRKYMVKWNKINLAVAIVGILVGVAAIAVDIFFRFAV